MDEKSSQKILFLEVFITIALLILIIQALITHEPILFIYDLLLRGNAFNSGYEYLGYCEILSFITSCLLLITTNTLYSLFEFQKKWTIYILLLASLLLLIASLIMFYYSYNFAINSFLGIGTTLAQIGGELLLLGELTKSMRKSIINSLDRLVNLFSKFFIYAGLILIIISAIE